MTRQSSQWRDQGYRWWHTRTPRERTVLMGGLSVVLLAVLWLGSNALWHFYHTLPERELKTVLRQRLIEDIKENDPSSHPVSTGGISNENHFLSEVSQAGVNGTCTPQGERTWLCSGQSASLESVQHWWMKGRFEGFYIEHFEAQAESPGRVKWSLTAKRS